MAARLQRRSYDRNQCALALTSTAIAFAFSLAVQQLVPQAVLLLFLAPVILSAEFGSFRAGVLATALSAGIGAYVFVPPAWSWALAPAELREVGLFVLDSLLICTLAALHRRESPDQDCGLPM